MLNWSLLLMSMKRSFSGNTAEKEDTVGPVAMAQLNQKYVPVGVTCVLQLLIILSMPFGMFNNRI